MENAAQKDVQPPPARLPVDWSPWPVANGSDDSVVAHALQRLCREPALLFSTA